MTNSKAGTQGAAKALFELVAVEAHGRAIGRTTRSRTTWRVLLTAVRRAKLAAAR